MKLLFTKTFVRDYRELPQVLNKAHMAQKLIFTYKRDSSGAKDCKELTSEFLKLR